MQTLPFKPLTTAILVGAMFPTFAVAAPTYGELASSENIVTEQNSFENVDYGVGAENGYSATVNSKTDLIFNVKKARAYVDEKKTGSIFLTAGQKLQIDATGTGTVDGLRLDVGTKSTADNLLTASANDIVINSTSAFTARGIHSGSKTISDIKNNAHINAVANNSITITTNADGFSRGISATGLKSYVSVKTNKLSIDSTRSSNTKNAESKAYGIAADKNGTIDISSEDITISAYNHRDYKSAESVGLYSEAGANGYDHNSSITIRDAKTVNIKAVTYGATALNSVGVLATAKEKDRGSSINVSSRNIAIQSAGTTASGVNALYGGEVVLGDGSTDYISISTLESDAQKDTPVTNAFTGLLSYGEDENDASKIDLKAKTILIDAKAEGKAVGIQAASNSIMNVGTDASNISIRAVSSDQQNGQSYGVWVFSNQFTNGDQTVVPKKSGEVNLTGHAINIYAEGGSDVRAVQVASNQMSPEKRATLNITGDLINIEAKSTRDDVKSTALSVMSTGSVTITGNSVIKADRAIVT